MKKFAGNWIPVDANQFNRTRKEERGGAKLEIAPSPYDLPEAIRGHVDDSTGAFVIDIRYITSGADRASERFSSQCFSRGGEWSNLSNQSVDA
ncbi:MAG TPA: hypothetical protein VE860_03520 [Chthoniobacterales bacterium]|nr:hypothetical protein [Chthoniobacterales bacterium]